MDKIILTIDYQSPCGRLTLGATETALCLCDWNIGSRREIVDRRICKELSATIVKGENSLLRHAARELDEYFSGKRRVFDVPLLYVGTDLRHKVWSELQNIPYGTTMSYGELARRIGQPTAVRAVASAIGANPLSIFIPCHRVIGRDGSLTGYAGGLDAKRLLLQTEGKSQAATPRRFG